MSSVIEKVAENKKYCNSLTKYSRRETREVFIGDIPLGAHHPIRIQSMTTVDTMDTEGSVEQCIRMVEAGCEYVRITAPSLKEAQNLKNIKEALRKRGYQVPLIADIHFTPNAAELAARIIEKVRVNPGNYADKKKFQIIEYTDQTYQQELDRIRERFAPLVKICKEYGTAMRIGTNHGSLSDRIMSRYGDTPLGMVESALEFLRICEDLYYYDIVLSMKASNSQVMVQAYRLLVKMLDEQGFEPYPLHLGVTEAGEGEDGRIKSALGIGTLLEDGLGDTVRVSLTEEPEEEAPVAKMLVDRYAQREEHVPIKSIETQPTDPFTFEKRNSREVLNLGGQNVPRVIVDASAITELKEEDLSAIGHTYIPLLDKWKMSDQGSDFIYTGNNPIPFMPPNGLKEILNYGVWKLQPDKINKFPLLQIQELVSGADKHSVLNFVSLTLSEFSEQLSNILKNDSTLTIILQTDNQHGYAEQRRAFFELVGQRINTPVVISRRYREMPEEQLQLYASTDIGGLLIDGFGDGVFLGSKNKPTDRKENLRLMKAQNQLMFGILQASRSRMSKTEYISCPSCGRTLFDLQETTAMIRKRTDHLKGVKIGIMGCIVNGPGEMADADYGYVGSGKGKITLYRGQEVVKRGVPTEYAVDELIEIIKEDENWIDPENQD